MNIVDRPKGMERGRPGSATASTPVGAPSGTPAHDTWTPDIETSSDAYRERFRGEAGRHFLAVQAAAVERLLYGQGASPRHKLRILDIGGGHGQITRVLLDRGHEVYVHGSAQCCDRQIRPLRDEFNDRLFFVCSNLWSLPFPRREFDVVIALRVMAHVERWRALLAEMDRVSRGRLVFDYASLLSCNVLTPVLFRLKRRVEGNTRPYFCTTAGRLKGALCDLGYRHFKLEKQFVLPMGLHRAVLGSRLLVGVERFSHQLGITRLLGSPAIMLAEKPPPAPSPDADPAPEAHTR